MSKEKKQIKQKDKIIDSCYIAEDIPYELCYYCKVIINNHLIADTDLELPLFNEFLKKAQKCPDSRALAKVMSYNIAKVKKSGWFDQNGCLISSKFQYFKKCILKGFDSQGMDQEFIDSLCNDYSDDSLPF